MSGRVKVRLSGNRELMAKARRAADATMAAGGIGLYAVANNIALASQQKTPVDTGNLRGSHYVTHPYKEGGMVMVELGVGTTAEDYAIEQHENTAFHHEEGEDHFMLKAIREEEGNIGPMVAAFARQALQNGQADSVQGLVPETPTSGRTGAVTSQAVVKPRKTPDVDRHAVTGRFVSRKKKR